MSEAEHLAPTDDDPDSDVHTRENTPELTPNHHRLKERLEPLFQIENILLSRLHLNSYGPSAVETTTHPQNGSHGDSNIGYLSGEVSVNSTVPWKRAFSLLLKNDRQSFEKELPVDPNNPSDPRAMLNSCSRDMIRLWNDPTVKALLRARKLRLEDTPGLSVFLLS